MATIAVSDTTDMATQAANLRAELKEWEKAFAAANGGKKAGRDDIKKNTEIAAKYKAYNRLKSLESQGKDKENRPSPKDLEERPKKRKHASPTGPGSSIVASTPRKSAKGIFETPSSRTRSLANHLPSQLDPYDSPSTLRRLFSPSTHKSSPVPLKSAIGPTPQRDGKTLGLFDLLSESGGSNATPSAKRVAEMRGAAVQTPSKRKHMDSIAEEDEGEGQQEEEVTPGVGRTPASSSKKWYLANLFATPTTLRYAAMVEDDEDKAKNGTAVEVPAPEPSETDTPFFLRRSNPGRYAPGNGSADGNGLSPIAVRKPPSFVGKGLSAIVQGLRDMEEEQLQDDWDVMREIEEEQAAANVQVGDSQAPEAEIRRPWKKKGQKRTTRRVKMKPVVTKPMSQPQGVIEEEEESDDELAAAAAAQQDDTEVDDMSEPELDPDSDEDYVGDSSKAIPKTKSFSEKMKEAVSSMVGVKPKAPQVKKPEPPAKKDEEKKPQARKINPEAHANYRSLKIRNKNSKGRGAGRFGRRR